MNVGAAAERFDHVLVTAQMGHDTQLNLRIIGREEQSVSLIGNKSFANVAPQRFADGDVLQVRVRRAKPTGRGDRLIERSMDFARLGIDQLGQGVDIRAQQLFQAAVVKEFPDDRMTVAQFLQNTFVRTVTAGLCLFRFLFNMEAVE